MSEFKERQIHQIVESIKSYKAGQLLLNKLVFNLEAIVAFNEMSDIRKIVSEKISVLEEINAYLLDGGQHTEAIAANVNNIIGEIESDVQLEIKK